ncbi:uncharacterized protein LOC111909842 [Lactuca sativa]|uniref:uncharacterized protein LOC111909842 n=1 Tax=Lactuca sativa TaxID=4236 RepID=UPI000CD9213C|nr:uncharacterized protein LOC111909842 [Lactuca sativa]
MERRLINASSGGSLGDMTPSEIQKLIEKMAIESKHYGKKDEWYSDQPRVVKEISNAHLDSQIYELEKVVILFTKEKIVAKKPCGIFLKTEHPTDMCQLLQEDKPAVKAVGGYQNNYQNNFQQKQQYLMPSKFHQQRNYQQLNIQPNFQNLNQQNFQGTNFQNQNTHQQPSNSSVALVDFVKSLAMSTQTFQTETRANIKNLEQHVSQLATFVGHMQSQGKLPGHTKNNPKHNVSEAEEEYEEILVEEGDVKETEKEEEEYEEVLVEPESKKLEEKETPTPVKSNLKDYKPLPSFPSRLKSLKRKREDENIMENFHKVELEKNISLILQKGLAPKCKDPRIFSIPCKLGDLNFPKVVLDLGASVNVLPYSVFEKLKMRTLQKTGTIIKLADHSIVHPKCVLEDVLVQVDNLIFPTEFYILDIGNLVTSDTNSIILGKSFMKTAKTKIDVFNGMISMEFDEEVVNFKTNNDNFPFHNISINYLGTGSPLSEGCYEFSNIFVQGIFVDKNLSDTSEDKENRTSRKEESFKKRRRKFLKKKMKIKKRKKSNHLKGLSEDNLESF